MPFAAAALPVQLTAFVGRERELGQLRQLISHARLVTLTGPGGIGKTRLALEAVDRLIAAGRSGTYWIELASHTDPEALANYVCQALNISVAGGGTPAKALVATLQETDALLVLDNCEHLVAACRELAHLLLTNCPDLRILCTSREALGVAGERAWLVPGLSLPGSNAMPDEPGNSEAVRLFADRARELIPDFELNAANAESVARICLRLDGLPLAIELAAARINVLTPAEIAERLDDRFALLRSTSRTSLSRHRTLHAAVEWSYQQLAPKERTLLERLSVFTGGFTLGAAEFICAGGEIGQSEVLDILAALVTRSLVAVQEEDGRARYRLLETINEFAGAYLRQRDDADNTSRKHAEYILSFARRVEESIILGYQAEMHRVDIEHDNIVAALSWSARNQQGATVGLPLCWAAMWYWFHRQRWREGFRHFETALATAVDPDPECRAAALHALGIFGLTAADPECRDRLLEAERIWRTTGNNRWLGFTLLCRTVEASLRRQPAEARRLVDETIAVVKEVGDTWQSALTIAHALAPVLAWEQRWEELKNCLIESEAGFRESGYEIGISYVQDARAFAARQLGDNRLAVRLACLSLRAKPQFENRWLTGRTLKVLGAVAYGIGELDRAVRLYAAADSIHRSVGANALTEERREVNAVPALLRESMSSADFEVAWEAGCRLRFDDAVAFALEMEKLFPAGQPSIGDSPADLVPAVRTAPAARSDSAALVVKALGPLEICRHGSLLDADTLRHARPRELLLYLLTHPAGRTREQVGLDFWPDATPAQVKNNFHVTLHYLRKAIGNDLVRYDRGRYVIDESQGIAFDVFDFERSIEEATARLNRSGATAADKAEATELLSKAMGLYRGPFMATESADDWHLEIRERLDQLYLLGLEELAGYHESIKQYGVAAELLGRVLSMDSMREDCARRLMLVLARDGKRADALRVFERVERELSSELGVHPERGLRQLADRIRQDSPV